MLDEHLHIDRESPYGQIPLLAGTWRLKAKRLKYEDRDGPLIELNNPEKREEGPILIKQNGSFFTYNNLSEDRLPKLGVFEPIFLDGKIRGWKAQMANTGNEQGIFTFIFTDICKCNKVKKFELLFVQSGFGSIDPPGQTPQVDTGTGYRIKN